jgi:hypothetical protein
MLSYSSQSRAHTDVQSGNKYIITKHLDEEIYIYHK